MCGLIGRGSRTIVRRGRGVAHHPHRMIRAGRSGPMLGGRRTTSGRDMLSTDQILKGLGLVIVLALASQLVSRRLRLPAIVLLLPVGFAAGAATDDVDPNALLGNAFQPLVSLGVGLILFEAGLRLRLDEVRGRTRRVVVRLVVVGPLLTGVGVALAVKLLFGLEWGVSADLIREDSGFLATTVMGLVLANQTRLDLSRVLAFQGTVVGLLIAILFVLISASVEPSQVWDLLPEGLALVAFMVLVLRPLTVALGTWRSELSQPERAFMAWLAPRGIVAASTASAFGLQLAQEGVAGADDILPIAFIAIFGTVVLYGLTAAPFARLLGLAGAGESVILVVGGSAWARAIAVALKAAGLGVRLWTGRSDEQAAAREEGLAAGNARLGVDLVSREEELEEVTDALLMTESDDFNALAAFELRQELGREHVYRLSPGGELLDLVPAYAEGRILFGENLTFSELTRRGDARGGGGEGAGAAGGVSPLFVVDGGALTIVTAGPRPAPAAGATTIGLVSLASESGEA